MRILCPTDFGPRARAAAQIALSLARRTGGSLEVLHVLPSRTKDAVALATGASAVEDQRRTDAQVRLAGECRELATAGVQVTSWLAEGEIEESIAARAATIAADLVVMGAHDRAALTRFILGSTAERTIRRADQPVLIVPPAAATPRLANGNGRLHVLVALDGRAGSRGAVEFARSLRARVPCDVTFLRLYWPFEEYARLGLSGARDLVEPDPDITADLTRTLMIEVGELHASGQTSFAIERAWGNPATAILDQARARECDLVIMGAESRHGLARIAHAPVASTVARRAADIPVVFAPPPEAAPVAQITTISTVLAPTDLSVTGNRAVAYAYALLAARGGVVELCHIHEHALPSPPYDYDQPEGKLDEPERARLQAELRALVPNEAERQGITTHVTVIDGGTAASAILQAAERLTVDSIVLGRHGRGSAHRALLGSVSDNVMRHAHHPVLVVPQPREAS